MAVIDLKSHLDSGYFNLKSIKGIADEYRTDSFFANNGFSPATGIQKVCRTILRKLQGSKVFMYGSVSMYGICSANLSRKSPRHRSMFTCDAIQTLSHGNSQQNFKINFGRRKRKQRLVNLRRLCSSVDSHCQRTLSRRRVWSRIESNSLRTRFNNNRPLPLAISVGKISQTQGRNKTPYSFGLARQYSNVYTHYRSSHARCQHPRRHHSASRSVLYHGSRLPRLWSSLYIPSMPGILYNTGKRKLSISAIIFSPNRQVDQPEMRSDNCVDQLLSGEILSRKTPAHPLRGQRNRTEPCVFDQLFYITSANNRTALQIPLAGGTIFQMDQTAPAYQSLFWHIRERREDSDMDSDLGLCFGCDNQKRIESGFESLHNSTDSERKLIRESVCFTSTYGSWLQN